MYGIIKGSNDTGKAPFTTIIIIIFIINDKNRQDVKSIIKLDIN